MRSCGRARKRDGASMIGVLLSKDRTVCSNMRVNRREHRAKEKTCQYNRLDGYKRRREAGIHRWR
jgi:hypothetical protein